MDQHHLVTDATGTVLFPKKSSMICSQIFTEMDIMPESVPSSQEVVQKRFHV